MTGTPPKVFISYSHDNERHEYRVLALANRLRADGIDAEIDQYEPAPQEGWPTWCERQIQKADYVLLVCSDTYLRRVNGEEAPGVGHGVLWEARIIRQLLYDSGSVSRTLIPVLFSDSSANHIPMPVKAAARHFVDTEAGYEGLYRQVTKQPGVVKPALGKRKVLEPKEPRPEAAAAARSAEQAATSLLARPNFAIFRDIDATWCPEMVAVPPGEFLMGSPITDEDAFSSEKPQHRVTIGYRFAIGRFEVTVSQYRKVVEATRRHHEEGMYMWTGSEWRYDTAKSWRDPGLQQTDRHPVVGVNWEDAQEYCAWVASKTGQPYRLPKEAEWEYACRAGTKTGYSCGDMITPEQANFHHQVGAPLVPPGVPPGRTCSYTTKVGSYPANAWSVCDMHGNSWEWVEDRWHDDYQGAPTDGSTWIDVEGISSQDRVVRGGSWFNDRGCLRCAHRYHFGPNGRNSTLGFRVARSLD